MAKTMRVQWFSSAKFFFSENEKELVFLGVFECGESKYVI
mgnify:CR=1 FL=1